MSEQPSQQMTAHTSAEEKRVAASEASVARQGRDKLGLVLLDEGTAEVAMVLLYLVLAGRHSGLECC